MGRTPFRKEKDRPGKIGRAYWKKVAQPIPHLLGQRILKRRLALNLTRGQFNEALGFPARNPTSYDWERGQTVPETDRLYRIARVLKCSVWDLLPDL